VTRRSARHPVASTIAALALTAVVTIGVTSPRAIAWARAATDERRFPHRRHEKLFPTCTGCHAGITTGVAASAFPNAESCTGCHNGTDAKVVTWTGPSRTPSNLRFQHVTHEQRARAAGDSLDCLGCHGVGADRAARPWMVVQRAPPAECITCHAHQAPAHLAAAARCETCHVPLVRAVALSDSAIARFSKPASHDDPGWISAHKPATATDAARCATCHTTESCARCHVNVATLGAATALGSDARVARLVRGRPPVYPVPATHRDQAFAIRHGALAKAAIGNCANCHAQQSCTSCHLGRLAANVIARLPRASPSTAPGVQLRGIDPAFPPALMRTAFAHAVADTVTPTRVRVHSAGFERAHAAAASSGQLDCAGCHQQRFCTTCHQGNGDRRYHQFNFVARHASDAYARETSCASCHNTETFCRACHRESGLGGAVARNRAGAAHGAQPLWLLQHGQAARQGLQSCASCHQQTDCLRCHSTVTQRVNPHGPDFDARRMQARSKIVCGYCHIGDPVR
jgi:hypothetical protein